MLQYKYSFSIDPNLYGSCALDSIKERLGWCARDSTLTEKTSEAFADSYGNHIHDINSFYLTNGDIIQFSRLNNEAFNLFQIDFKTGKEEIPRYFNEILKDLKASKEKYFLTKENKKEIDEVF